MIHVIAIITAKPGMRDQILEAARGNLAPVRAEDGCIEYSLAFDAAGRLFWTYLSVGSPAGPNVILLQVNPLTGAVVGVRAEHCALVGSRLQFAPGLVPNPFGGAPIAAL